MCITKILHATTAIVVVAAIIAGISYGLYRCCGLAAMLVYLPMAAIAFVWTLHEWRHPGEGE